ncbi:NAD(+)-dependent deacetylase, silent information regulator protein family protein [Dictyostelium discoideum AX4]|uniref:NAD-dependent deacetylase sir2D n=1 Tax=Dictyostelium discoideum TaxID=44689 RepID=SIR2D_DICDI|nr:NAD(+)-dependent deacetylase, silent information regulator protein family protein [Dictyostelium discoideum AX4]Q54GV7.1 RecName: Full=NAD-dependent deacetylase sir2D; AltName: Full=Silent information regulator sir2D [Dictyostelium discoideum]EAL62496.1 NAD(+)-dependent deacetylase, silent information regulator protein family protein [Dictyostelium discoideum AX4]|eukprot:XP_635962.1 NAD(+)-dependent deacetylase, silent information regulator protein family protein [Dictyostelium discoideum AX4]
MNKRSLENNELNEIQNNQNKNNNNKINKEIPSDNTPLKKLKSINSLEQLQEVDEDEDLDVEIDTKLINKLDKKGRKYEFVGEGYSDEEQISDDYEDDESSEYEYGYENEDELLDDEDHLDNINEIKKIQKKLVNTETSTSITNTSSTTTTSTSTTTTTTTKTQINETILLDILNNNKDEVDDEIQRIGNNVGNSKEEEGEEEEENIELVARSFIYKHIQEKKSLGIDPIEFTKDIGFKLELEKDDDAWEIITAFLTRKKVAVNLFLNYLKYNTLARPYRKKIATLDLSTFEKVCQLFESSKNIVIITGAGVSVSCGIPDFRSKGGVYETIEKKYNLPRPESLFDIHYLRANPLPFFEFAKEIFPGNHKPSPTHSFIKLLDEKGKLLRNYTQNIDTLEHVAGIDREKLVNCHGSFSTATCITCKLTVDGTTIRDTIMKMEIPLCQQCNDGQSFMKPDIVFFGENLPDRFDQCVLKDVKDIDLLIVMGSSLQVQPVSLLPDIVDKQIPQILINRELVAQPHEFDYVYLGDCDQFVQDLLNKVKW